MASLLTGCAHALVSKLAFHPQVIAADAPQVRDPRIENVPLITEDGIRICSYYVVGTSQQAILFFHGNAGHAEQRLDDALQLAAATGAHVFLVSYRGYGRSEGAPSESGVYADARAALRELERRGFSAANTFVLGRSLGSAVAMDIAFQVAGEAQQFAGMILVTPLSSGRDMARSMGFGSLLWCVGSPFDSLAKAKVVTCPALFIHGEHDRVIPMEQAERLFAAMPTTDKSFERLPNANHNNLIQVDGARYWRSIADFVTRYSTHH